ncbi:NAD(P)/FAD-dependent oxidoreductase [Paraburkholderia sediminicola]|nr:NAD(P)/FAD-dependent oxidoreductase [Paraburkholderia sediminicola]
MNTQQAQVFAQDFMHEVVIVGSGFGGLCMGARLKEAGINNFVILEKDEALGGTWRVNHYPGAACDVPSHLYSFSFAQNADWTRKFPPRDELWAYTQRVAEELGLVPHVRLNTALEGAEYDEARGGWTIRTSQGTLSSRLLVTSVGALGRPSIPKLPGLESFSGKMFHSSQWDHDYDLRGKRVAVVGTGASAIQFVPEIVGKVAHLDLYQRTPPWILPRPDRRITGFERWLLANVKPLQWLYRGLQYLQYETRFLSFSAMPRLNALAQRQAMRHLRRQVPDNPALRARLTPDYRIGCKRILLMNDYYPAVRQPHVDVLTCGIQEIRPNGILGRDGVERPVDAILFGTGFDVEHALGPIDVRGRDGVSLRERANGGLEAYKGCTIAGFPNFFMITGPNTGLGHNSMIYMIESGVNYVMDAIHTMRRNGYRTVEVRADVQARYNEGIQKRLKGTVWNSGCKSWYLAANGKNHTLWPGFAIAYHWITRRFDTDSYCIAPNVDHDVAPCATQPSKQEFRGYVR